MQYRFATKSKAMTLVESIIAITVVAWLLTMAINSVGAAKRTAAAGNQERLALEIAQSLLAEIAGQPYADDQDSTSAGPSATESATGNRSLFNDVNDYEGWIAAPPQAKDGIARVCPSGWREEVDLTYLNPGNIDLSSGPLTDLTRIRVLIYNGSGLLAQLTTIRSRGPTDIRGCCLTGGTCATIPNSLCTARGGAAGGKNSMCFGSSCTGLVAYWPMDEGAGATAEDHSESNDISLAGVSWGAGKYGTAVSFASGSGAVPYDSALSLDGGLTICAWIYKNSNSGFDNILIRGSFNAKKTTYHLRTSGTSLAFGFHYKTLLGYSLYTAYSSGVTLQTGKWQHVAATFDPTNGEVVLYVDGIDYYTGTTVRRPESNSEPITVGKTDAGDQFDGMIDDLRIYNTVLKKSDIIKAMNEPSSGGAGGGGAGGQAQQAMQGFTLQ